MTTKPITDPEIIRFFWKASISDSVDDGAVASGTLGTDGKLVRALLAAGLLPLMLNVESGTKEVGLLSFDELVVCDV